MHLFQNFNYHLKTTSLSVTYMTLQLLESEQLFKKWSILNKTEDDT